MPKCFLGHLEQKNKKRENVNGNFPVPPPLPLSMENSITFFSKPSLSPIKVEFLGGFPDWQQIWGRSGNNNVVSDTAAWLRRVSWDVNTPQNILWEREGGINAGAGWSNYSLLLLHHHLWLPTTFYSDNLCSSGAWRDMI